MNKLNLCLYLNINVFLDVRFSSNFQNIYYIFQSMSYKNINMLVEIKYN